MMRYPQELVELEEYNIPEGDRGDYRITAKELAFSEQLIDTMSGDWDPAEYRDEFRERLHKVINDRMKADGVVKHAPEAEAEVAEGAATNVVDFMSLLQRSIDRNKRTPARKAAPAKKMKLEQQQLFDGEPAKVKKTTLRKKTSGSASATRKRK